MRAVRAGDVRGEVVVGEVVDEEVEPVAGDEPTADRGRVRVDRPERAVAHGDRGAGLVALVEGVEEEALRAVDRRHAGDRRQVAMGAAVARDVDRAGRQAGRLERLVDRLGAAAQVLRVQVDHRVAQRPRDAGRAHRAERRAVLDDPLLTAMPPDEVRDLVHVGMRSRGDRREADRRQRREGRRRAPVGAVLGEEPDRGRVGCFEHRRRQAVDDHEDDGLQSRERTRSPAWRSGDRRRRRAPSRGTASASR